MYLFIYIFPGIEYLPTYYNKINNNKVISTFFLQKLNLGQQQQSLMKKKFSWLACQHSLYLNFVSPASQNCLFNIGLSPPTPPPPTPFVAAVERASLV